MGKLSLETTHLKSAPGAQSAIAPSEEGGDRLFRDYLSSEIGSPGNKAVMQRRYFQNLSAHGIPAELAEAAAKLIAQPQLPDNELTLFKLAAHLACKPE